MAVGAQKGRINLDTIELLFLLAALAIVPQGLDLSARLDETSAPRLEHWAAFAQPGAALLAMASFFLPPDHESKWAAEEIVRNAGLDYTVVKAGVI